MEYRTFEPFPLARDLSLSHLFRKFEALSPTNKTRIKNYIDRPDCPYGRAVISKLLDVGGGKGALEFYPDIQFVINNSESTVRRQIDTYNDLVSQYNQILEGEDAFIQDVADEDEDENQNHDKKTKGKTSSGVSSPEEFIPIDVAQLDRLALEIQQAGESLCEIPGFYGPDYGHGHRVFICRECKCAIRKGRGTRKMTATEVEHKQMRLKTLEEMNRSSNCRSSLECEGDFCGWNSGFEWLCESCRKVKDLPKQIEELRRQTKIPISWEECKCKRLERDGHI